MAGTITHSWNGTILTITSDSGTSSADLKGAKGDNGIRGPQGRSGIILNPDGTIDTTHYATEEYVEERIAGIESGGADLSNYYTKAEIDATLENIKVDLTGYATEAYVIQKINEAELGGGTGESIDLSIYALKSEIPDVSGYALKSEIPDVSGYALKTEIPSVEGLATEEYVNQKISEIQVGGNVDLSNYYTKTEVDEKIPDVSGFALKTEIPDVSGYQTAAQVQAMIDTSLGVIENGTY